MAKPPYGRIAGIAKHGTDENLLAARDEIRWLARWADDIHGELQSIWRAAEVVIGPEAEIPELGIEARDVTIRLRLSNHELDTLIHLLKEDDE